MEAVEAHRGAKSKPEVAAPLHIRRIGRQHQIELYGDVRGERLGGDKRAPQIELLLSREDEMNCGPISQGDQPSRRLDDDRAAGAIVNRSPREALASQRD